MIVTETSKGFQQQKSVIINNKAPSLIKAIKLQPPAEQPSTKQTANHQKKRYPTPEDKEEATSRQQEGRLHNISNPTPTGWAAHRLESNCITETDPWE